MTGEDKTKAKTLQLTAMERVILMEVIPSAGRIADAIFYARMRSKLDLNQEEMDEVGMVRVQITPNQFNIQCKDHETRFPIELTEEQMDRLIDLARGYANWPSNDTTVELIGQLGDVSGRSLTG